MSTRSSTHFMMGDKIKANVYRHTDGYPEGHGIDIHKFFQDVEWQTTDTRFNDPTYLAAKMVVWLAAKMAPYSHSMYEFSDVERLKEAKSEPLNFLSVGVQITDPLDIEYIYEIHCDKFDTKGRPIVKCYEAETDGFTKLPEKGREISIPIAVNV